jgi:PAS domain S-box-containing protein
VHDTVHWSDQQYKIFGIKKGEKITYKTYLTWVEPEDRGITEKTVEEACNDHQPYSLIHRIKRSNGTVMWLHVLGEVLCDSKGTPIQMIGTVQDITDRFRHNSQL